MPSPSSLLSTESFNTAARLQALPDSALCAKYACSHVNKMHDWLSVGLMHCRLCLILPCMHLLVLMSTNA